MFPYESNLAAAGNSPLVKLQKLATGKKANVYAKIEARNPGFSIKDRIAIAMVDDAEKRGLLHPGDYIVEPTSGNTGIGLAFVAAIRGYKLILVMPDTMSIERQKLAAAYGAKLELTSGVLGMKGSIDRANEIFAEHKGHIFMPLQFENPANAAAHEATTGPEIWEALQGKVDAVVAGVGTGGTITGIARYFKNHKNKKVWTVAVEPAESPLLTQQRSGLPLNPGAHKIQGIGANFIPKVLDMDLIDEVIPVSSDGAIEMARKLPRQEGILAGISSGAALIAALSLADRDEFAGKNIVVIFPDSGERYLSSLFEVK